MSDVEVHTITKPVWDMTGGENRKYAQKDHPEFLIDIVKKSDYDTLKQERDEYREMLMDCVTAIESDCMRSDPDKAKIGCGWAFEIEARNGREILTKWK